ncbi:MAG: excinuclease ABC subunit UvrA [Bacteroidaceae bacterium]|nr:excinuclease ABC subunit UvrA [Bacteroidaceae bacterium]
MPENNRINVLGARVHNLKNVNVSIPRDSLTVITGLSGSGKSSLAFDTIFAEGQRRYIETFSSYARNYMDNIERPDVDQITGLSPVISIDQKTTNKNPRSTVGTVTEVYDFLRLLFARIGQAVSYESGERMVKYTEEKIVQLIVEKYQGRRIYLLSPVVRNRKGHYRELFDTIRKKGFLYARIDGEVKEISQGMKVDRYVTHNIEVVIDKMAVKPEDTHRLAQSVATAFRQGSGMMLILDAEDGGLRYYSKHLMDPVSGLSYRDPSPNDFSFNTSTGACPRCKGLGVVSVIDMEKIVPNPKLSIKDGGIIPLGKYKNALIFWQISSLLEAYDCTLETPIAEIPQDALNEIFDGSEREIRIRAELLHASNDYFTQFDGLVKYIRQMSDSEMTAAAQRWAEQFNKQTVCPVCNGARLSREARHFFVNGKNIHDLSLMNLSDLYDWMVDLPQHLDKMQGKIGSEIIKEICTRLQFLLNVGLGYLCLHRSSATLSGGESQRIRLATQIGSQLVNVLYILDEPSIGLHQRDNMKLIRALKELRDIGNTVIVVEHDKEMMLNADYIVDVGPRAGRKGGEIVFEGKVEDMLRQHTLTSDYLNGTVSIPVPADRRAGNGKALKIIGASGNNLKHIDVEFPLGKLICVTGVSGSGKSSLITDTLLPILSHHYFRSLQEPLPYDDIVGLDLLDKVVDVDQSPLGRTPRSNPATYTGVFSDIRNLFVNLPEAAIRGYKPGRFSFNISGGRCETCKGNGYKIIEMNFLPNVLVPCETCHGKRYNRETLEVRFKGKSIADVLDMTINQAVEFFANVPHILHKIKVLQDVGLGYIKLGQSSTTLSGGESQRVKLATELSKRDTGRTLYILDEPTTGLHFEDIRALMSVLNHLVDKGNTVIVIEHNLDVIKKADHIIDMGPEGGQAGGTVVTTGTPEEVALSGIGNTAPFIKQELGL